MDAYTPQAASFTQGPAPWRPLANYQAKLPTLFDTSGMSQAYERQISDQYDMSRANAAAAMSGYANRAAQSGASQLGAGFAGGQAMLGGFRAANQLRGDLAGRILQSNTAQAGIGADLASRMGALQSTRQGQLSEYQMSQQRLQQGSQQFNADLAFRQQQLAQQQLQFNSTFNQRNLENQGGYGGGGGNVYGGARGNEPQNYLTKYGQGQGGYDYAGASALPNGFSTPGYITNSGPIQAAQYYGQNLQSNQGAPAVSVAWGPGGKIGGGREPIPAWMRQNGY